jgi:hypothetical protein
MNPPRIEEIEYSRFNPYSQVPYHNDDFSKYAHAHLDIVNYLNEKELNPKNYYFAYYNDYTQTDEELLNNMNYNDPFELIGHQNGHGHGHNEKSHKHH